MKTKRKVNTTKFGNKAYKDLLDKYRVLSYFMDHIPDVIYFKDRKGRLTLVNKAHAKGLGLKPEQVKGKTDFDLFPKKRAAIMAKDDNYVMKTGKSIIDKIERATRADKIDNYVSTTKIPRYDEKGKIVGLIGITRDITRRRRFENIKEEKACIEKKLEMLEELNKIKSEFVSVVSHELRTPLAIVKQLFMLLFNETAGPVNDKQREILRRARNNIERLKSIIDDLLDISRIETDRLKLHYSLINLNDLIKESSDFFKKLAQEKRISLTYLLPKKAINLFVDAERINQVISNLISNAIKFTEDDGQIKVEVKILATKVRICVSDTGIGIAKADLSKLFNKFVQVCKKSEAEKKGVGLGLSIAKELIERHGGEIWVESQIGVGSKFYFTLPRFYAKGALDKRIKSRLDKLLSKGMSVYFVNLLIVNYNEFKERIKFGYKKLFSDFKLIIDSTAKKFRRSSAKRPHVLLLDTRHGNCSILFPGATEKEATEFSNLLKNRIKKYFVENKKMWDVFVALGLWSYRSPSSAIAVKQLPANIINEIYIGSEMRRSKRIPYKTNIKIYLDNNKTENSQTVDISEGGVCFISRSLLVTDSTVKVCLEFTRSKKYVYVNGRVSWMKMMERAPGETTDIYKVGLEFINLKNKDRKIIMRELKL